MGWNPFLERLAWFIKKYKPFNQSNIASDIASLMLTRVEKPAKL